MSYNPFGMVMPGRNYTLTSFDYGFNNKLNDNDIEGNFDWQDYGMREYLPRLGRFASSDPLSVIFPWWSSYQFAGNTPTHAIDLDGKEVAFPTLPLEPLISLPKVGNITVPTIPDEIVLDPPVSSVPSELTAGQPQENRVTYKTEDVDWSNVDLKDPNTWPTKPFGGQAREGEPSRAKPAERGEKSWYDEDEGEWRAHKPDKYHPEGHWDYKPKGENTP
jgi:RHS repeat-associated protein